MRCGVSSFVGAFGSIGDQSGMEFSTAFFELLLQGATVGEALRRARRRTARRTLDAGMFYTAFGYTEFRLVEPDRPRRHKRRAAARPKPRRRSTR